MLLTLRHGAVSDISVYSDANDAELPGRVRAALMGANFGSQPIAEALRAVGGQEMNDIADYVLTLDL